MRYKDLMNPLMKMHLQSLFLEFFLKYHYSLSQKILKYQKVLKSFNFFFIGTSHRHLNLLGHLNLLDTNHQLKNELYC